MLEARHSVVISKDETTVLTRSQHQVLEQGALITIGQCQYTFEYTDHFSTEAFALSLSRYMRELRNSNWLAHSHLLPGLVREPRKIGNYLYSPRAIAEGTFGKVQAGWARDGSAVAIKQFKAPKERLFKKHIDLMNSIGEHNPKWIVVIKKRG